MSGASFESQLSSPNFPDFTSLAEKLQEAAQAFLAFSQSSGDHDDSDESKVCPESPADDLKPPFEIRSYEIPDYILRGEQDLLKKLTLMICMMLSIKFTGTSITLCI